jgi:hypothetical protein
MKQVRRYIAYLFAPAMLVLALVMPASATTTLQLENGNTLSFADGSIDLATGSGELFDIALSEDGVVVLTAEYLFIDASGSFGETDWYVHDLVVKQAELAEENIFIGEMEIRDIAMGMLVTNAVAEMQDYATSDSFVLLRNVGMTTDEALISIDRIQTLPFAFAELSPGQIILTSAGIDIDRMTVMPLDGPATPDPFIDELERRGITEFEIDFDLSTTAQIEGGVLGVTYRTASGVKDLSAIDLGLAFTIDSDVYARLLPTLMDPDNGGAALLAVAGAVSFNGARIVLDDSGLIEILFAAAASEQGVSEGEVRSMSRMMLAGGLQQTFPENVSRLLPPIEAMLQQGGTLTISSVPPSPVPLSSAIGFAMFPDLAIDQLGITITHMP